MKKLGFGMMRLPRLAEEGNPIDVEEVKRMVDLFIERGFTYFDTAWMYCDGKSECVMKEALADRYPRSAYLCADKLHINYVKCPEDRDRIFNEQLKKTGVGYFDNYLLHAISESSYAEYERLDCFGWIAEKKKQGLIKNMGFSFHARAEVLERILTDHPEMDFVQLQINYLDWENPSVESRACYEIARRHNKKIIVMEPIRGGRLAEVAPPVEKMFRQADPNASVASWAVRFAASLEGVTMVLSGMSNTDQLRDNTSYMQDFKPLTEEEFSMAHKAREMILTQPFVPCTACSYCTDGCPARIPIPELFAHYNKLMSGRSADRREYAAITAEKGKAGDCVKCGHCEEVCPQSLKIRDLLEKVAEKFE